MSRIHDECIEVCKRMAQKCVVSKSQHGACVVYRSKIISAGTNEYIPHLSNGLNRTAKADRRFSREQDHKGLQGQNRLLACRSQGDL